MKTKTLLGCILLILSCSFVSAHAALVTSISGLEIVGVKYNVTFHVGETFGTVFDDDADGIFGESDDSIIDHKPTFWGDEAEAFTAASAIIAYLGDDHWTSDFFFDGFFVPIRFDDGSGGGDILAVWDTSLSLTRDAAEIVSYFSTEVSEVDMPVSFEVVPTPSTIALAGLAIVVMGVMRRRRRAC